MAITKAGTMYEGIGTMAIFAPLIINQGQPGIPTIRALIISGPLMVRTREASDVICAIGSITQLNFSLNASINLNTRLPIYMVTHVPSTATLQWLLRII
uniref:Uncharacterized protein n=1 Tax=Populus trichocarpa TaxID=3694 RepID=A0A3N7FI89_POPTR